MLLTLLQRRPEQVLRRGRGTLPFVTLLVLIVIEAGYVYWLRHLLAIRTRPAAVGFAPTMQPEFALMLLVGLAAGMISVACAGLLRRGSEAKPNVSCQVETAVLYTGVAGSFLLLNELLS